MSFPDSLTPPSQVSTLEETEVACSALGEQMGVWKWGEIGKK